MTRQDTNLWQLAALGLAGAAAFGAVDAARTLAFAGLSLGLAEAALLVLVAVGATSLLGILALGLHPLRPRLATPVALGALVAWSARLLVDGLSDPPPFQEPTLFHGSVVGWVLLGLLAPVAALVGVEAVQRRWARAWVPVVGIVGLAMVAALVVPAHRGAPPAGAVPDGPNVLLITLDTTRADRLDAVEDTPAFDRLAAGGVRFERAMSQIPVTGPSHASLLSGVPPWEHGMFLNGTPLPADLQILPEALHAQGYQTAAFVSAYVLSGELGFSRGFDVYDDDFGAVRGLSTTLPGRALALVRRHQDASHVLERRGDRTVDQALQWLDGQDHGPWLAWVHLFDPHGPYAPPPPYDERYYRGRDPRDPNNRSMEQVTGVAPYLLPHLRGITDVEYVRARYDGELAWTDAQVARLLDHLDATGQADDTLVILAGDHGEGLGEEGEWFNHGDCLYDHDLNVPLVLRWPGVLPAGRVVPTPVELTDVVPTVADYLGFELGTGVSLRPAIDGERLPRLVARSVCYDREANRAARERDPNHRPSWRMATARGLRERVIVREHPSYGDEVRVDAGEASPEVLGRLGDLARELLQDATAGRQTSTTAADQELLEALGYVEP